MFLKHQSDYSNMLLDRSIKMADAEKAKNISTKRQISWSTLKNTQCLLEALSAWPVSMRWHLSLMHIADSQPNSDYQSGVHSYLTVAFELHQMNYLYSTISNH